jgi:hypothetical protein
MPVESCDRVGRERDETGPAFRLWRHPNKRAGGAVALEARDDRCAPGVEVEITGRR